MLKVIYQNRCLTLWSGLLLGLALPAEAVEDQVAIAIAVPVEGITIDGDLSDWPEDMTRYHLTPQDSSASPKNAEDFRGEFRIGWNAKKNALYIAVEVWDDSIVIDTTAESPKDTLNWDEVLYLRNAQDGCEIYLDGLYESAIFGNRSFTSTHGYWVQGPGDGVELGVKRLENKHQYEWQVDLEKQEIAETLGYRRPERIISPRVLVWDKDADDIKSASTSTVTYEDEDLVYNGLGTHEEHLAGQWPPARAYESNVLLADEDIGNISEKALARVGKDIISYNREEVRNDTRIFTTYQMLSMGMLLVFTLLHLLLFLFYPRSKGNLYYALFTGALCILLSPLGWLSNELGRPLIYTLLALAFGLRFLYSLFYTELPKQFWIFLVGGGIIASMYSHLFFMGRSLDIAVQIFAYFFFLAYAIEVFRVVIVAIIKKKDGALIVGGGFIGFILITIYLLSMHEILAVVTPLTVMSIVTPMSIHLARNVARTSKNLEVQLVQVEELSAKNLEQERALRAEAEKELQTAHEMQMALMPKAPPQIQGFEITGRCIPANHVGGDLFQYFHQFDRLSISLADVTGHAMEAAIPVVMFSGILRSHMGMGGTVEELFGKLNQALHGTLTGHTLVCLAMGQLDPTTRRFRFSNAGCPYPYHYRAGTGEVVELRMDAYPLGVRPDTTYRGAEIRLEPGDRVVFCSDGIAEAANEAGEMFGFERTAETVRRGCAEDLSAEGLLARIIQEVKTFSGEVPQGDDQTVVVLKVDDRRSA